MTETKTCPRCGTLIRPDETPAGLCAACLMKMGFDSRSGAAEVVLTESERVERAPAPTIEELTPHFPELEIIELVGRGGMGAVYRAKQRSLDRDVALKILTVPTGDATFADRFQREARTLATLSHPGITAVFDFGQRGPWSFLAMEFVEGASLRQMLRARELGSRESLAIVSQMCDALQYAHDKGVVHRDIKPENVLVTRDGRVKVLDFGLAKLVGTAQRDNLTRAKQVMGTPHYMAPEQWEKPLTVDHRADIYALGVVFYELLTGELPLGRFAPPSHKVAVDVRLDDVVLRSLEKEPDRRYQHASQVKDEVAGITSTPAGVPPVVPDRKTRPAARKWIVAGFVLGCLLLLLIPAGLIGFLLLGRNSAANEAQVEAERVSWTERYERAKNAREQADPFLAPARGTLVIDEVLAERLGIPVDHVAKANSDLQQVWTGYLNWERQHVDVRWLDKEVVEITPVKNGRPTALLQQAENYLKSARLHPVPLDWPTEKLEQYFYGPMRFAAPGWRRFELTIRDGSAVVKQFDVKQFDLSERPPFQETVEMPPSAAMQRMWNRAALQRDYFHTPDMPRESLAVEASTAAELGIPQQRLSDLNRDLERAWTTYLDWESKEVRVGWITPEVIEAGGGYFPGIREVETAIARATPRSDSPDSAFQKLMRAVRLRMHFAQAVPHEFSIRDATAVGKRIQRRAGDEPEISEEFKESPPSPALQRVWNRAITERDHFQSK